MIFVGTFMSKLMIPLYLVSASEERIRANNYYFTQRFLYPAYRVKEHLHNLTKKKYSRKPRTTISQDVQARFSVQLAFTKFLSKIKGNFLIQCQYHGYSTPSKISLYSR